MFKILPNSIMSRVVALCSLAFVMIAAAAISMIYVERRLVQDVEEARQVGAVIRNVTLIDVYHDGLRSVVYGALSVQDNGRSPTDILKELEEKSDGMKNALAKNKAMNLNAELKGILSIPEDEINLYVAASKKAVEQILQDKTKSIAALQDFDARFEALVPKLESNVGNRLEQYAVFVKQRAQGFAAVSRIISSVLFVLALISMAMLSTFVVLRVVEPFRQQVRAIISLAHGKTEITTTGQERNDEIGELARSITAYRETIIEKRRHENAAAAARIAIDDERRKKDDEDTYHINAHKVFMSSFTEALERFSLGDLNFRLHDPYAVEYEAIRLAFNQAASKMHSTMVKIVSGSEEIRDGTEKILSAANELSYHTEEQASSLEETSASMEEMAATVRQNATNAQEASAAAMATRDLATSGSRVAVQAVGAMEKIERSSRQVTEIVSLIEEIAFQTNILALNAAVEAARAGEAGKGFAVVANEVRALSQRSSQSLKDIKALIIGSNADVTEGSQLVKQAGASLNDIVVSVKKVADLISEIAAASQEQAAGVDQVSRAVSNMDEMTQQNAALVQETNAALHLAQTEIHQLNQAISMFDTGHVHSHAKNHDSAAPRPVVRPQNKVRMQQGLIEKKFKAQRTPPNAARTSGAMASAASASNDPEWLEF